VPCFDTFVRVHGAGTRWAVSTPFLLVFKCEYSLDSDPLAPVRYAYILYHAVTTSPLPHHSLNIPPPLQSTEAIRDLNPYLVPTCSLSDLCPTSRSPPSPHHNITSTHKVGPRTHSSQPEPHATSLHCSTPGPSRADSGDTKAPSLRHPGSSHRGVIPPPSPSSTQTHVPADFWSHPHVGARDMHHRPFRPFYHLMGKPAGRAVTHTPLRPPFPPSSCVIARRAGCRPVPPWRPGSRA
jgi:hypothetical protein